MHLVDFSKGVDSFLKTIPGSGLSVGMLMSGSFDLFFHMLPQVPQGTRLIWRSKAPTGPIDGLRFLWCFSKELHLSIRSLVAGGLPAFASSCFFSPLGPIDRNLYRVFMLRRLSFFDPFVLLTLFTGRSQIHAGERATTQAILPRIRPQEMCR